MLYSMTGFGKALHETSRRKISVEIKTLNSKQVDLSARIPAFFRPAEFDVRALIAAELQRGKIDVIIGFECLCGEITGCSTIKADAVLAYKRQIENISNISDIPLPTDWYNLILHLPGVISSETDIRLPNESDLADLNTTIRNAIEDVNKHRRAEGEKLEAFFTEKINAIRTLLAEIDKYEIERVGKIRAKIEDNLSSIKAVNIDMGRFEQEMIFYIEKLDVNEEKQRLKQHLNYFLETMKAPEGQGKKLGFIAQEMGREINTLGSKSNHAEMQKLVVMMKDHLEQIKEQVLNVL